MDDEKEFYIVNGRVCGGFRTKPWFESHENPAEQIRKELSTKVDILIVLEDDMSFAYLNSTFKSICNQSLAANSVHVVNNQKDVKVSEVHSWLVANTPKDLSWSLTNVLERKSDKSLVSTERALDIAVPKLKGFVYAVFRPGYVIPSNFCLDIDQSLRVLIGRWSVLRPDYHDNGLVVHRGFHMNSLINGNSPMPAGTDSEPFLLNSIVEKADYIAKTEDMPWLIEDVRTICREM
jgi:hypothetical protein